MTKDREFYRSKSIEVIEQSGAVIFIFSDNSAMAFSGKRTRPDWFYSFLSRGKPNPDAMRKYIAEYLAKKQQGIERKAEINAPCTLVVGDILVGSWGYEQTNLNWFQVVELKGKRGVIVRPISQRIVSDGALSMSGSSTPLKDQFFGEPEYHIVNDGNTIKFNPGEKPGYPSSARHNLAVLWNGRPHSVSWYA